VDPDPIIIVSLRDREEDKIAALDAGADDYLTKPFGVGELTRPGARRLAPECPSRVGVGLPERRPAGGFWPEGTFSNMDRLSV